MHQTNKLSFLQGGGEMGQLTRNYDWSQTSIGIPEQWPQSLRTTLGILLSSKFPMFLFWGKELICFYNDAYRPSLGNNGKHPSALGKNAEEVWPEIWDDIKPQIDLVFEKGGSTWSEDHYLPIYRNGKIEDVYWTYSYSPVFDESGITAGVFVTCTETTEKVTQFSKLEESRQLLEFAIEATELATWDYDPINKKFTANHRYNNWFGIDATLPTDNEVAIKIIAEEDREKVMEAFTKAVDPIKKANYDIEYKIRPVNLPERIIKARGKGWFNTEGIAYRLTGTLQDVTEQVMSRKKIEESETRFATLLKEAPIPTSLLVGKELKIELANEAVLQLWGKKSNVVGKTLEEAIPELKGQHFLQTLQNVFNTGIGFSAKADPTKLIINGEEQLRYFDFTNKPIFNTEGKVWGILSMGIDVTEQVLTRKKIEESEHRYRTLIEESTVATALYGGNDLRIQYANDLMLKYWDKDQSVIGKTLIEAMPELKDQSFPETLEKVYRTGEPYFGEKEEATLLVDGKLQRFYFNYTYKPLRNKQGEIYGVHHMAIEVTKEVLAQQVLEKSEQNLRNVILQAPFAMCILTDEKHVVEIANEKMLELWGANGDAILHQPLFDGLPAAKGQGFEELLHKVYHTGETVRAFAVPVLLPRGDGPQTVHIDFVYEAYKKGEGEIIGVMAIAVEVTDQVIARKKIEESEERARLAIESARLGTYEVNYATNQVIASPRMDEIFNVKNSNDPQHYLSVIHPDDLSVREKAYEVAKQTGRLEYDARITWQDGSQHWIRIEGKYIVDKQNIPVRLLGVVQDITEQKLFEDELNRLVNERTLELQKKNIQLENINSELEQFTYAASHDMQEPLRKVNTFSSFLLENYASQLDERGKSYLSRIGTSVLRMKDIIDDLLNYSHQTREEQQSELTDLNKILDDVEADLEVNIEQKNATIKRDTMPTINAVPTQMNQLFANLYSNALKFTKADTPVNISIKSELLQMGDTSNRIELDPNKQYVKIIFIDDGIGFEQQYAEQIFSLFKRLHGKTDYEGTGIGLGLCKKILKNHGGAIWAESEVNKGSAFYILLPANA